MPRLDKYKGQESRIDLSIGFNGVASPWSTDATSLRALLEDWSDQRETTYAEGTQWDAATSTGHYFYRVC